MKKSFLIFASFAIIALFSTQTFAQCQSNKTSYAKQASMTPDIVDIAIGSKAHTTLVAAVKAADLVGTLKGEGPFTVFAPTNDAFGKLPAGTVETLLKPENKGTLVNILTYHVIPAKIDAATVVTGIKAGGGTFKMKTVSGGTLIAKMDNDRVALRDEQGNTSYITATDLKGDNGYVHVIDSVVLPN